MQAVADENPNAQVLVRAIKFSDGAQWHVSQPTDIADFKWEDLSAGGVTSMGKALDMVAEQLKMPPMSDRALPPVLVLISDGQPTDDYAGGIKALMDQPWGKKAVRIAIAIGEDADQEVLRKFIGNPELKPLQLSPHLRIPAIIAQDGEKKAQDRRASRVRRQFRLMETGLARFDRDPRGIGGSDPRDLRRSRPAVSRSCARPMRPRQTNGLSVGA